MKMNNKGQGLLETLLALGIGSVICVTALMSIFLIVKASRFTQYSAENKSETELFADTISKYISRAVEVDWVNGPIGNVNGRGGLRNYRSGFNLKEKDPVLVGAFLRESGRPTSTSPQGDIRATALFFMEPTITTPGRVFIATSEKGEDGNVGLSSDRAQLVFDNIVEFSIRPTGLFKGYGTPVRIAEVRVVHRKFLDPDKHKWKWCPASEAQVRKACENGASAKDTVVKLVIPLYNNALNTSRAVAVSGGGFESLQETILGDLYLFSLDGAL